MTHRFVVPSALVELLLAEQTTATLCSERLGLDVEEAMVNTTGYSTPQEVNFARLTAPLGQ